MKLKLTLSYVLLLIIFFAIPAFSQMGSIVRENAHCRSLEKTATGELPDRSVTIYLPQSYQSSPKKKYPIVYLPHGIGDTEEVWTAGRAKNSEGYNTMPALMNKRIAEVSFGEVIVAMPEERTKALGCFYVNSSVTGIWEGFTSKGLARYVGSEYRRLAEPKSRGLAGHWVGRYGAVSLGMKHPEVFSVVYGSNPAIISWAKDFTLDNAAIASALTAKIPEESMKGGIYSLGFISF